MFTLPPLPSTYTAALDAADAAADAADAAAEAARAARGRAVFRAAVAAATAATRASEAAARAAAAHRDHDAAPTYGGTYKPAEISAEAADKAADAAADARAAVENINADADRARAVAVAAAEAAAAARTAGWGAHSARITLCHLWRSLGTSEALVPGWVLSVEGDLFFFYRAPFPEEGKMPEIFQGIEDFLASGPLPWRKNEKYHENFWEVR